MKSIKRVLIYVVLAVNSVLSYIGFRIHYYPSRGPVKDKIHEFLTLIHPVSQTLDLIRIGSDNDGGYLIPNDLDGIKYCFSPGVSLNSDFEEHLATYGIKSFLADYSVDGPVSNNSFFHFTKKYLGNKNNTNTIRLEDWIFKCESDNEMILQMDIEGSEYEVILDTPSEILRRFRIIVIEFHNLSMIRDNYCFALISTTLFKLMRDFKIVHAHANNCCKSDYVSGYRIPPVIEITFLRNDRVKISKEKVKLPNSLDRKNDVLKKDVSLPYLMR
jgi:hypothetical protein